MHTPGFNPTGHVNQASTAYQSFTCSISLISMISTRFSGRQAKSLRMHPAVLFRLMNVDPKTSNGEQATTSQGAIKVSDRVGQEH